eukprot:14757814-Ditylum_brightwellii.AAC.1
MWHLQRSAVERVNGQCCVGWHRPFISNYFVRGKVFCLEGILDTGRFGRTVGLKCSTKLVLLVVI